MHVQYSPTQRRFRFSGIQHIRVEYHQQCGCECIQQSKDCNHGQIYRPNECRCVCSLNDRLQCVRQNNYRNQSMPTFRFWNEINCQCQCRLPTSINQSKQISKIENCPSGYHFNYVSCRSVDGETIPIIIYICFSINFLFSNYNKRCEQIAIRKLNRTEDPINSASLSSTTRMNRSIINNYHHSNHRSNVQQKQQQQQHLFTFNQNNRFHRLFFRQLTSSTSTSSSSTFVSLNKLPTIEKKETR